MKRITTVVLATLIALPLLAQQKPASDDDKIVASLNAENITLGELNHLYDSMPAQMRDQYDKNGGKSAFLDNYMRKRLLIQEAMKQGFDKRPDVVAAERAAMESALFDRYVREVVASSIVTDAMVQDYYQEHLKDYERPEQVKARHILITFNNAGPVAKTQEQAQEQIKKVSDQLKAKLGSVSISDPEKMREFTIHEFDAAARLYSEDGTARQGGDLGWFGRSVMDPQFESVVFAQKPGTISEPFQSPFGYHIVFLEAKRPAGNVPFSEVKDRIREQLVQAHGGEVLQRVAVLTNELRRTGKVAVYPENVK